MTLQQKELFQKSPLLLENGETLSPVLVGYETYGTLSASRDNCILLEHALTGTAHAAKHFESDAPGWWDDYIGPGKTIDTDKYFLVCTNVFGGCSGTTGPSSINTKTGELSAYSFQVFRLKILLKCSVNFWSNLGLRGLLR